MANKKWKEESILFRRQQAYQDKFQTRQGFLKKEFPSSRTSIVSFNVSIKI